MSLGLKALVTFCPFSFSRICLYDVVKKIFVETQIASRSYIMLWVSHVTVVENLETPLQPMKVKDEGSSQAPGNTSPHNVAKHFLNYQTINHSYKLQL